MAVRSFSGSLRLLAPVILLMILGLVNQYSASATQSHATFYRQLIFYGAGAALYLFMARALDYRVIGRLAGIFWIVALGLLLAVLIMGSAAGGSTRWVDVGFIRFQPSELCKFTTAIAIAAEMARRNQPIVRFSELLRPIGIIGIPAVLIFVQPDLGTAAAMSLAALVLVVFGGIHRRIALIVISLTLIGATGAWFFALKPYQKTRVMTMLDPEKASAGSGYQVIQSKIAIASGGITGRGFLQGQLSHGKFLPEQHTDFAFAVFAEEWGLIGALTAMVLLLWMLWEITSMALSARESLGTYFCVGAAAYFFVAISVNTLMVLGWMPTVGIPLPFFTYGGSHTLVASLFLGLTQNVYARRNLF
jgi:rod shape determining protein RodA